MKNLLNQLNEVVDRVHGHHTNHQCSKNASTAGQPIASTLNTLAKEHETELQILSANSVSSESFNHLIKSYQTTLIRLLDTLYRIHNTCQENPVKNNCPIRRTVKTFTDLLCFLRQQFPHTFDENIHIPLSAYEIQWDKINQSLILIRNRLQKKKANSLLLTIALHPFADFLQNMKERYSFCDLAYLHSWITKLNIIGNKPQTQKELDKLICFAIIQHNLNSQPCMDYFFELFSKIGHLKNSREKQLQILNYFLKCINQVTINTKFRYDPNMDNIKSILTNWLREEVGYIENSCHINEQPDFHKEKTSKRIPTNIPVTELAIHMRLWVKTNILPHKNNTELITIFSKFFSSIDQPQISYKSLYNKYYVPEPSSIEKVEKVLVEQLELIRENKI
ncbi:MAG: hypothetical protein JEZ14_19755 [Marinilabiliaceae bacterium]|nr:hypothetical protein [Marinilabiliaceae bacterium]